MQVKFPPKTQLRFQTSPYNQIGNRYGFHSIKAINLGNCRVLVCRIFLLKILLHNYTQIVGFMYVHNDEDKKYM